MYSHCEVISCQASNSGSNDKKKPVKRLLFCFSDVIYYNTKMDKSDIHQSFWEKCIKDKHGKVVLWQMPNVPLWGWIISTVLAYVFSKGKAHNLFQILAFGSLFAWAYLEITSGINYFRRVLGAIVLIVIIINQM